MWIPTDMQILCKYHIIIDYDAIVVIHALRVDFEIPFLTRCSGIIWDPNLQLGGRFFSAPTFGCLMLGRVCCPIGSPAFSYRIHAFWYPILGRFATGMSWKDKFFVSREIKPFQPSHSGRLTIWRGKASNEINQINPVHKASALVDYYVVFPDLGWCDIY